MPTLYTALKMRHGPKDRTPRAAGPVTGFAVNRPRLLSESFEQRPAASVGKRVIVVGAGFAGLAAAYEMFRLGYDVMILEARKRLGGRVFSLNDVVSGKNVEGGGELIGSNHPTWLSYRDHFNLNFLHVHDGISSPIVLQGKRLTERESRKLSKDIDLATDEINTEARKLVNQFQPWTQPKALDLDKLSLGMRIRQLGVSRRCKIALAAQFSNDNGVSCDNQSYLGVLAMIKGGGVEHFWNETEVYRCEGGNQQLAIKLAHPFDDQHLKLNSPVKEINIGESSASVLLHSGDRLSADDVILAVPPSVWDSIVFDPALPLSLRPKPQMGKNVKFIISLNEEFWIGTGISPDMSSDGPIGQTWHSTQEQSGDGAALVAFSGSDRAVRCGSWKPLSRPRKYVATLGRVYKRLENSFVEGRFMNWPHETWTKASYSFPAPKEVTRCGPVLREGVLGRLHFAGEHTCYAFVGYMEGALHSGVRVAKQLARRDGFNSDPELY